MERVRVGLIGAGNVSRRHASAYAKIANAEVYAVCDVREARARERAAEWGATKTYTGYRKMLDDSDIDAVEILTPHHLHLTMGLDAIASGKHVSIQKPMATTIKECDQLIAAAAEGKGMFRTFENFQYYPPIVRAKELLDSGVIGKPISLRIKTLMGSATKFKIPFERWDWRFDPEKGGGGRVMLDYGSHVFAVALYLLGDIEKVFSWISYKTIQHGWKLDCPAVAIWKYRDSDRYGTFEVVHSDELKIRTEHVPEDEWFEITGSRGVIWVNRCSANMLDKPPLTVYLDGVTTDYSDIDSSFWASFDAGCREFVDAIVAGRQARLTAAEGKKVVRMCRAIEVSARENREVLLDDNVA